MDKAYVVAIAVAAWVGGMIVERVVEARPHIGRYTMAKIGDGAMFARMDTATGELELCLPTNGARRTMDVRRLQKEVDALVGVTAFHCEDEFIIHPDEDRL